MKHNANVDPNTVISAVQSASNFEKYFSFQIFFIFLRESLEIVVIISILLSIVKQGLSIHENEMNESAPPSMGNSIGMETVRTAVPSLLSREPQLIERQANRNGDDDSRFNVEEEEEIFDHPGALLEDDSRIPVSENGANAVSNMNSQNNMKLYKRLKLQILAGGGAGILVCMLLGFLIILIFYYVGTDLWSMSEHYYEGILSLVASVIISIMGLFFLRMGKLREKFRIKLASIIYSHNYSNNNSNANSNDASNNRLLPTREQTADAVKFSEKYAFFILPFITALREGLEAMVYIGGIGIDQPLTSIPLSMLSGATLSGIFGYFFFQYSKSVSLKICLIMATCFLYIIAAGLFSKGVWQLEVQDYVNKCGGQDMSEVGNGPGSYDISRSVWHVNCCNGERDGAWMIFTAIFGWTNSATYGSVISYMFYWAAFIIIIKMLMIEEQLGYIPYVPIALQKKRIIKRLNIAKAAVAFKNKQSSNPDLSNMLSPVLERPSGDSSMPLMQGATLNNQYTN
ncbi:hypothetical protein TBLA_0H03510 [Henningerozyma blattae CBS 6284]|uniref:Iron transporter FTH1 n=1 Tax=Henningerozyma blattae (strain ATCC 34711 / CBS 6284 / DSM 70876 / NBRC 10599 / NRRL Y-10934 / UCD 77-7) TaxID=1071380 RepID=I2H8D0_HENB6|nr:hypothetical protein TBLA_0H03510 [Tetrapisispora blattae CBS 6284]CCH62632.1 hypothetical protein TBLA_0H03510 [Tetrapisispora blattae CBS 6284]